jgi:WD40 repeat protein
VAVPGLKGAQVFTFGGPGFEKGPLIEGEYAAAAFTGDGRTLALSSWPATVGAWNSDGTLRWKQAAFACTLAGAPDGSVIAAGSREGGLRLLDAATGVTARELKPLHGPVRALAFSPDGSLLAAAADDHFVQIVQIHSVSDTEDTTLTTQDAAPRALAFSRKGLLAAGGEDGKVRIFDLKTRTQLAELPSLGAPVSALAFSPAQDWLASGRRDFGGARLTRLPEPIRLASPSP